MRGAGIALISAVALILSLSSGFRSNSAADEPPCKDPALPVQQRVDDLAGRLTLQEKISQMTHSADAIDRLGVPEYNWWNECLHGVARAGIATVYPRASGIAAFKRIHLRPGQSRKVELTIPPRHLSIIGADLKPDVPPGRVKVAVGGKQPGQKGLADAGTTGVVTGYIENERKP